MTKLLFAAATLALLAAPTVGAAGAPLSFNGPRLTPMGQTRPESSISFSQYRAPGGAGKPEGFEARNPPVRLAGPRRSGGAHPAVSLGAHRRPQTP